MNDTTNNTLIRGGRRGLRARIGVGLLSLGLASGAGVLAMGAQPASAATITVRSGIIVNLPVPTPFPGVVHALGVSWS